MSPTRGSKTAFEGGSKALRTSIKAEVRAGYAYALMSLKT